MVKLFAVLLSALLAICPIASADEDASVTKAASEDTFISEHADEAISCADSEAFYAHYYVVQSTNEEDLSDDQAYATFVLSLTSKLTEPAYDIELDVHLGGKMSRVFASPIFYSKPIDLYPAGLNTGASSVEYAHDAVLDLSAISSAGGITVDDLYDMYIEVSWCEGTELTKHSEIWNISLTGYQAALDYFDTLPEDDGERDYALVDEDAVNALNERASALDT